MAKSLVAAHGADAAELALMEEDAAWRRGKVFEQGLWRQIRRQIESRMPLSKSEAPQNQNLRARDGEPSDFEA